ncbi:hypothetical protein QBC44DRAFT_330963 [Cladorrhinum sp. PSN332]|nr:hypothetical protein QBC44DRAFT_330963 [Cladorrhinum sp. PSN332]
MGADLATRHSIPSLQDPSILAPVICNFPPDTAGCGQLPYPHWYETQSIKDDGSYLQTDGYSPHALFTNEPPISPPLSELDTKRRATIDASFLQQPNEVPVYRVTLIESEPTSASSYFPVSPYSHAPQHDSPSNPVHPGQYMFAEQQQAAEEPSAEQKPGTEKLKRKRGRPPTRIDSLESKRTPPNDTSGVSPLSSITFGSIQSEPAPNTGASSSTIGGRPTLQARNRAAANRYRAKTQAAMAQLEAEEREVSIRRQSLLVRAGELRDEVFQLKNEVFKHANCGCPRIEGYLENAAQQAHAKQALFSPPLPGIGGSASSRSSSQS